MFKKVLLSVLTLLLIGGIGVFLGLRYFVYYPNIIVGGENVCWLGRLNPAEDGFTQLQEIADRSVGMRKNANVAYFEASLDDEGCITTFTLSLEAFDENGVYIGLAGYRYNDKKLLYDPPVPDTSSLVHQQNPNSSLAYLSEQIKKIPLVEQIKKSELGQYHIRYQPYTLVEKDTPIFDGRSGMPFEVLSPDDYNAGKGGFSDGETNVVFLLYDGVSMVGGQLYYYIFEPTDTAQAIGNPTFFMECDYYINNGSLQFTRNYGQDAIDADITANELSETMEFYRNSLSLPPESLFISPDKTLPLAYFYGSAPTLKISADNGETWETIPFPKAADFGRSITRRAVGFVSPQFGYAALGTDWSMGGGEHKMCYFTFDGGKSWTEKELPHPLTSKTLMDIAMADEKNGVVALSEGIEGYLPLLFATTDTGDTWTEIALPYDNLPPEAQYLTHIDSLHIEDGKFVLTLGQGDSGTIKATFSADELNGIWEFVDVRNETIHTVG